eukprot:2199061-Prymnesium_polylepis.3
MVARVAVPIELAARSPCRVDRAHRVVALALHVAVVRAPQGAHAPRVGVVDADELARRVGERRALLGGEVDVVEGVVEDDRPLHPHLRWRRRVRVVGCSGTVPCMRGGEQRGVCVRRSRREWAVCLHLQAPAEEPVLVVHGTLLETVPQQHLGGSGEWTRMAVGVYPPGACLQGER